MPRTARLDLPGLMQHVIVRGIERRRIFLDDGDHEAFCARLSMLLEETGTDCLAWALMPNVHLLLRSNRVRLATFMRRLLTGYAVTFNLCHGRSGHLFQNRYRSIGCEEEPCLMKLVRDLHLNPLRGRVVKTLQELESYRWSGHAVVTGRREFPGQAVEEVLERFSRRAGEARVRYAEFIAAGAGQGRRDELAGGGLRRSGALSAEEVARDGHDERVLGSAEFVERVRREEIREAVFGKAAREGLD